MTPETPASISADHITDAALHDEIKCRTYQLYEERDRLDGHDVKTRLQAELPRVLYAATEVEKYLKGEVGDIRSVRAARVYLRVLSSIVGGRNGD
jgi:hypothetical protein